jgi:hypothetical protein
MLILIAMVVFLVLITVGTDVIEGAPEMAGQSLGDYMRSNSKVTMDMYVEVKYNTVVNGALRSPSLSMAKTQYK